MSQYQQLPVGWAKLVFELLNREGLDASILFQQFDIDKEQLNNSSAYFKQDSFTLLWEEVTRLTGNPAIGLKMGNNPTVCAFDSYISSIMSSATLRECFACMIRYQRIIGLSPKLLTSQNHEGYLVILNNFGDELPTAQQGIDASLAFLLFATRFFTNENITPVYVEFKYPKPKNIQPYQDLFQCNFRFSGEHYCICFKNEDLNKNLVSASENMANHHDKILRKAIKALNTTKLSETVSDIIHKKLPSGEPHIAAIAQQLNTTSRTLQRRLKEENLSFLSILSSTRKRLAHQYITDDACSVHDAALLLGFTDVGNFYRAFKRWFGCTPGKYREKHFSS